MITAGVDSTRSFSKQTMLPNHRGLTMTHGERRGPGWYQKFYSESRTGQLMLLRDDEPQLYGQKNNRGPDTPTLVASTTLKLLTRTHALLWVLIILVGLILFRIWK